MSTIDELAAAEESDRTRGVIQGYAVLGSVFAFSGGTGIAIGVSTARDALPRFMEHSQDAFEFYNGKDFICYSDSVIGDYHTSAVLLDSQGCPADPSDELVDLGEKILGGMCIMGIPGLLLAGFCAVRIASLLYTSRK